MNLGSIPHKVDGIQLDGVALAIFDPAERDEPRIVRRREPDIDGGSGGG
jgi:hypothetical protein